MMEDCNKSSQIDKYLRTDQILFIFRSDSPVQG